MHKHLESHLNNYRVKIAQGANCHNGREIWLDHDEKVFHSRAQVYN